MMKTAIITRRQGIKLTKPEICVRYMDDEETAKRYYPYIRYYERIVFESKNEVRFYSPSATKWYNSRKPMDGFKTIYLTD